MTRTRVIWLGITMIISLLASAGISANNLWASPGDISLSGFMHIPSDSLVRMASDYYHAGKNDSSMIVNQALVARFDENSSNAHDTKIAIRAMYNLGFLYDVIHNDYNQAYRYYLMSLDMARQHKLESFVPVVESSIGGIFQLQGSGEHENPSTLKAIRQYKTAYQHAVSQKVWDIAMDAYSNMVSTAYMTDNLNLVSDELRNFMSLKIPASEGRKVYNEMLTQGVLKSMEGKSTEALALFSTMEKLIEPGIRGVLEQWMINYLKIHELQARGTYDEILPILRQSGQIARENDMPDMELDVLKEYSAFYENRGDRELADRYLLRYYQKRDSLFGNNIGKFDEIELSYNLFKAEEDLHNEMAQRQRQRTVTIFVLALTCLTLAFLLVIWRKNRLLASKNKDLFNALQQRESWVKDISSPKYTYSNLDNDEKKKIAAIIADIMQSSQEIYQESFSLSRLSELSGYKTKDISQVINEQFKINFRVFLNEYRIMEACRRLSDDDRYGAFTIEAIARDLGFKSRSSFIENFKKVTKLTPSEYKKQARMADK